MLPSGCTSKIKNLPLWNEYIIFVSAFYIFEDKSSNNLIFINNFSNRKIVLVKIVYTIYNI